MCLNSAFSGDAPSFGGAIYNKNNLSVTNSTICDNYSNFFGGGIYNETGLTNLKSSIVARNGLNFSSGIVSQGFNVIDNNDGAEIDFPAGNPNSHNDIAGTSSSPIDPKLDPNGLQNNGGPTKTIALLANSPAIDRGTSNGLTGRLATDQRGTGFARTFDYPFTNASGGDGTDVGAFELLTPFGVSRKMHGAAPFDIPLLLSGTPGVECRTGGMSGNHQVIMTFPFPVVSMTSAAITSGAGFTTNYAISGGQVTVNLSGVANAQTITLTLFGVSDGTTSSNVSVSIGILLGDTSGNESVNSTDVSLTKSKSGQVVDSTNFREDVNANGSINASDVSSVKLQSGTSLP
jgi:hypothetical protein